MDAEKLVKISREDDLLEDDLQDVRKEDGATKSLIKTVVIAYNKEKEEEIHGHV